MKYYIYNNNQLRKVRRNQYELWLINESNYYSLKDYTIIINETMYAIETIYAGAIEDDEDPLPFVICRVEAELTIYTNGIGFSKTIDETEYYDNFEEFKKRYSALINQIKSNFV